MVKTVCLIGGNGTIGQILQNGLEGIYDIYTMDKDIDEQDKQLKVDALDYHELKNKIPEGTDTLINLLQISTPIDLVDVPTMSIMVDLFFKASYHIFQAAVELGIPKVIVSSSNHATDFYEDNGYSTLKREVTTKDYPYTLDLYGAMKLATEHIGFAFSKKKNLQVINLRIGTVPEDEKAALNKSDRVHRTLLSHVDVINLYKCAIESQVNYGVYYGVSDNADKPWDMGKAKREIGFQSLVKASDISQPLS